jgi:hypothetical protein
MNETEQKQKKKKNFFFQKTEIAQLSGNNRMAAFLCACVVTTCVLLLTTTVTRIESRIVRVTSGQLQGPSSSASTYLVPAPNTSAITETVSVISVADVVPMTAEAIPDTNRSEYRFVGNPDGMHTWIDVDRRNMIVVMNHEISAGVGVKRRHGGVGAFVSRLTVDRRTLKVVSACDAMHTWHPAQGSFTASPNLSRFCSSELPPVSATFDEASQLGTRDRFYLTGEEIGGNTRAIGIVLTGEFAGHGYELHSIGRQQYENIVLCPKSQRKTIAITSDDNTSGYMQVYVGDKTAVGTPLERAGLVRRSHLLDARAEHAV